MQCSTVNDFQTFDCSFMTFSTKFSTMPTSMLYSGQVLSIEKPSTPRLSGDSLYVIYHKKVKHITNYQQYNKVTVRYTPRKTQVARKDQRAFFSSDKKNYPAMFNAKESEDHIAPKTVPRAQDNGVTHRESFHCHPNRALLIALLGHYAECHWIETTRARAIKPKQTSFRASVHDTSVCAKK